MSAHPYTYRYMGHVKSFENILLSKNAPHTVVSNICHYLISHKPDAGSPDLETLCNFLSEANDSLTEVAEPMDYRALFAFPWIKSIQEVIDPNCDILTANFEILLDHFQNLEDRRGNYGRERGLQEGQIDSFLTVKGFKDHLIAMEVTPRCIESIEDAFQNMEDKNDLQVTEILVEEIQKINRDITSYEFIPDDRRNLAADRLKEFVGFLREQPWNGKTEMTRSIERAEGQLRRIQPSPWENEQAAMGKCISKFEEVLKKAHVPQKLIDDFRDSMDTAQHYHNTSHYDQFLLEFSDMLSLTENITEQNYEEDLLLVIGTLDTSRGRWKGFWKVKRSFDNIISSLLIIKEEEQPEWHGFLSLVLLAICTAILTYSLPSPI
ncbi:hypothetical protein FT663_02563 [Candidozyma haemuli var. vulneris]|nr:hypothetical protein FT662_04310 [[Candida] haemuloni var. vulneris]KAF3991812.1 hypothetical protein FT663_02563 [[Candida] haemuloni var. vulneris]